MFYCGANVMRSLSFLCRVTPLLQTDFYVCVNTNHVQFIEALLVCGSRCQQYSVKLFASRSYLLIHPEATASPCRLGSAVE